ncbi:DUF3196 family protein [Amphibacillus cookii]|uniref:DUF3196 family protein n=1 Tax=Amphibacillus cookii TaxID=767787 RepID=UPI001958B131|nr:DUF3196 family protein [Amphibacillus cookii]MBM7541807.1 tetratricopeptide (TPR) repeat protein [Amphibacillus cookii]
MNRQHDNVVLFPKQKQDLEKNAYQAMQDKQFADALNYLNQLIAHGVTDQEVALGKLTCLIELGRQKEAEQMCEDLIAKQDDNYFSYINIYATLLFQFHKHKEVAELLDETLEHGHIPSSLKGQLKKLYEVNQPLVNEQVEQEVNVTKHELEEAIDNHDTMAQWHLINHLQRADIKPYIDLFANMLVEENIHPVIKTVIVSLLQAESINQEFEVVKFSQRLTINPSVFPYMNKHPFRLKLKETLADLEQKDPSFYRFSNQLIDRYFYVHYPFVPKMDEIDAMNQAVIAIVKASFDPQTGIDESAYSIEVLEKINRMIACEQIYFSIMEE